MTYRPPPFEVINPLVDKVMELFISQPGPFSQPTNEALESILLGFATGQFIIKIRQGEIKYFACYWMINPEDIEAVEERIRPANITNGSMMYVVNLANAEGRKGLSEVISRLRAKEATKGVFWHRPAKQDRVFKFPRQRGTGVIYGQQ